MHERQTKHQEQRNPIEGATDGDAEERDTAADVHWISRPGEHTRGRKRQCRLRRSNVCADAPKNAICPDHHSKADDERNNADYDPYLAGNMIEQIRRHNEVEDNSHYQNRERNQRWKDDDAWGITGIVCHGVQYIQSSGKVPILDEGIRNGDINFSRQHHLRELDS